MECQLCDGVKTYYVFHDQPQVGCLDVPQKIQDPITLQNGTLLEDLVGVWPGSETTDNGTDARTGGVTNFNAWPLLQYFGGAHGMVTASRVRPLNATAELGFDEDQEDRDEWLDDYRFGNASTAVRFEHAFLRFDESGSLYEDIQGSFYWRSVAGDYLVQYRRNHTGFYSNVQSASIAVYRSVWVVTTPPNKVKDCNQNKGKGLLADFFE